MSAASDERADVVVRAALRASADPVYGAAIAVRDVENAALGVVDPARASRVAAVDRRFDGDVRALRNELRVREEQLPGHPHTGDRAGGDLLGFLAAACAFGVVMAGMSMRSTPGVVFAPWFTALGIAAVLLHAGNAWRTRNDPPMNHVRGYLVLSAILLTVASAVGFTLVPELPIAPIALAVCAVVTVALAARAIARWRPTARLIAVHESAFDAMMSELNASLAVSASAADGEFAVIVAELSGEQRTRFETLRQMGLDAFAGRDDTEHVVGFDAAAPVGALRYATAL